MLTTPETIWSRVKSADPHATTLAVALYLDMAGEIVRTMDGARILHRRLAHRIGCGRSPEQAALAEWRYRTARLWDGLPAASGSHLPAGWHAREVGASSPLPAPPSGISAEEEPVMNWRTLRYDSIDAFKKLWPCHNLPDALHSLSAEFDKDGNLVDLEAYDDTGRLLDTECFDGPAFLALVEDCQRFGDIGK